VRSVLTALFCMLLIALPAAAQDDPGSLKRGVSPEYDDIGSMQRGGTPSTAVPEVIREDASGQAVAQNEDLTVDVSLCRQIISHTPRGDVAHKPASDGHIPADLPNANTYNPLDKPMEIPLDIDLAQRLDLSVTGLEMYARLPPLVLHPDGKVFWQGRDISMQTRDLCEQEIPPNVTSIQSHGLNAGGNVTSPRLERRQQPQSPPAASAADMVGDAGDDTVQ
jgi:hypothetical protein